MRVHLYFIDLFFSESFSSLFLFLRAFVVVRPSREYRNIDDKSQGETIDSDYFLIIGTITLREKLVSFELPERLIYTVIKSY